MAELKSTTVNGDVSATGNVTGANITSMQNQINELNSKLDCKFFRYSGICVNGSDSDILGHGSLTILLLSCGIAQIHFSLQITQATTTLSYSWGINRDFLTSTCGKLITPLHGGTMTVSDSTGVINEELQGYGSILEQHGNFWLPARTYDTNGSVGGWGSNLFKQGQRLFGVCYGTYQ